MIPMKNPKYAYVKHGKERSAQFLLDTGFYYGEHAYKTRVYLLVETSRSSTYAGSCLHTTCEIVIVRNNYFNGDYSIFSLDRSNTHTRFTGFMSFTEKFSATRCSEAYLKGEAWRVMLMPAFETWVKTCFEHLLAEPGLDAEKGFYKGDAAEVIEAAETIKAAYAELSVDDEALDKALNAVDTLATFDALVDASYLLSRAKDDLTRSQASSGANELSIRNAGELIAYLNAMGAR